VQAQHGLDDVTDYNNDKLLVAGRMTPAKETPGSRILHQQICLQHIWHIWHVQHIPTTEHVFKANVLGRALMIR
jgi:hypothetical protein